uniref:Transposase n=1 Tax=Globodera pallida TaxID=36090 RepID=A0A183CC91_GLOPA
MIQKAHISIDEYGTAASPSTAAELKRIDSPFGKLDSARTFQPDHSFAFFVTLHRDNPILGLGVRVRRSGTTPFWGSGSGNNPLRGSRGKEKTRIKNDFEAG